MQQVIQGERSLLQIPALLKQKGARSVLLVTGSHLLQDSLFQEMCARIAVPYQLLHPAEGVLQIVDIPTFANLEAVVAIGGGKVMDYAKGIIHQYAKPVYFIAAPTTAGSGSEATPIAVFYNGKEKVSLDAPFLLPQVAILDPVLLSGLPPYQRAVSGADALAQCIESVWNRHSTPQSEEFALTGLALLWKDLPTFVSMADEAVNERMLWAAHLAGRAITLTRTTGPHALSYYLTAHYGVPHGQAVALTLPLFFLYNAEEIGSKMKKLYKVLNVQTAEEAFLACRQLFKTMGLATALVDLQQEDISLDAWLQSVNQQRFANNPVPFDPQRLKTLFERYLC